MEFLRQDKHTLTITQGFIPNMKLSPIIYANKSLSEPLLHEHFQNITNKNSNEHNNTAPEVSTPNLSTPNLSTPNVTKNVVPTPEVSTLTQLAHISTLPSLTALYGMPDLHCGYGFPIGSVAGFNLDDPECLVSPGGVGYDINCGVRCVVTSLDIHDIKDKNVLADMLYNGIPSGTGNESGITKLNLNSNINLEQLNNPTSINYILEHGLEYLTRLSLISESDLVESQGSMQGNSHLICQKAKARGTAQLGSLGSGNHYLEIQSVSKIFDKESSKQMGIMREGQLEFSIHTGSRGVGHITCGEYLKKIGNDNLGCVKVKEIGGDYLEAMACASNYAFCNRAIIDKLARSIINKIYPHAEMNLLYDVCHNIAKKERHTIDGNNCNLLVHRKGASRSFGPFCDDVPEKYKHIGQPVLVGGSMGTSSYILAGTQDAMKLSLGSACHGAGRLLSRGVAKKTFSVEDVLGDLKEKGIVVRAGSEKGLVEEAPGSYKDVDVVAELCEDVGIARRVVQVKPLIVIKG